MSFHLAFLCWKSPVHPLSDSAISVWLAVSDLWASKIHWSSANDLSSMETNDYNNICPPCLNKPIHERTVCCWQKTFVVIWVFKHIDTLQHCCSSIFYHCFNVVCWGKGIRWPAGLWHLVSTISLRRRWDLWNGSYTYTWVLVKPPVKAIDLMREGNVSLENANVVHLVHINSAHE